MRCVTCGADTDAALPTCQRCGSALPGAVVPQQESPPRAFSVATEPPDSTTEPPGPTVLATEPPSATPLTTEPPSATPFATEPPGVSPVVGGASGAMSGAALPPPLWDLLVCAVLFAGWALVLLLVALARGAQEPSEVPGRLALWHYVLAALAVAIYLLTAVRGVPESPGYLWARAARGDGRDGDLRRGLQLLVPTVVVTVAVALVAGMTVPLSAAVSEATSTSATPTADDEVPTETPPTPDPVPTTTPGPETPTPTVSDDPDARRRTQAQAVDALLSESIASRGDLAIAIAAVGECRDLNRSLGLLDGVTRQRRTQRDQAEALTVDALTDGPAMRSHLVSAFTYAGDADAAYAAWTRRSISSGCSLDANWRRGNQLSEQSQKAKNEFLRRWNPIATSCGLPTRTSREI